MVGGLRAPPQEDEDAAVIAEKGGIYFVLEDADLQVGKVGKVSSLSLFLLPTACRSFLAAHVLM
jgi:hypothetical protein